MRQSYLFVIILVLFVSVFTYNSSLKKEIALENKALLEKENKLKEISDSKKKWKINKATKNRLTNTLNRTNVKKFVKTNKLTKNSLKVKLEGIDKNILKDVSKKLFEGPFQVKSLELQRDDKHKASFEFGVEF